MDTENPHEERRDRNRRVWLIVVLVLWLAMVWGHYESVGASRVDAPHVLVTTATWRVFGQWPWLIHDQAGVHLQWPGLLLGLLCTGAAAFVLVRLGRRRTGDAPEGMV